jgi:hypothetical protein
MLLWPYQMFEYIRDHSNIYSNEVLTSNFDETENEAGNSTSLENELSRNGASSIICITASPRFSISHFALSRRYQVKKDPPHCSVVLHTRYQEACLEQSSPMHLTHHISYCANLISVFHVRPVLGLLEAPLARAPARALALNPSPAPNLDPPVLGAWDDEPKGFVDARRDEEIGNRAKTDLGLEWKEGPMLLITLKHCLSIA